MDFDSAAQPPVGTPWHEATFGASFVRFWRGYAVFRGRTARAEFWFWALWWFLISLLANIAFGAGVLTSFTDPSGPAAPPPQVEQALEAVDLFPVWGYLLSALPPVAQIALGVFAVLSLASLVPWIAITVRRLHDTGRSGWWVLLAAVPLGNAVLAVLLVLPSITESTGGAMAHPTVR
jgi:uncharacterized membrane protein YhaH (DUF805 family)